MKTLGRHTHAIKIASFLELIKESIREKERERERENEKRRKIEKLEKKEKKENDETVVPQPLRQAYLHTVIHGHLVVILYKIL